MSRWQYWLQERGGNKNIALMELVACSMVSLLVLYALLWYVWELVQSPDGSTGLLLNFGVINSYLFGGLNDDKDYSQVPFLTAAYFLYVLFIIVLFRWSIILKKQKKASRNLIAGFDAIAIIICAYFIMESSEKAFDMKSIANVGVVASVWHFERSGLMNFYFTGFIFRNKQKTWEEVENVSERRGEEIFVHWSFLVNLFFILALLYVLAVWMLGASLI